jgi:two-component system CheB/CheR fusion protein
MAARKQRRKRNPEPVSGSAAGPPEAAETVDARALDASAAEDARTSRASLSFPIVGVGASAGGLEAFTQLLRAVPVDTGMAFVLVQHLAPSHGSALAEILSRATSMPVTEVADEPEIEPNRVYVIPPDRNMVIVSGHLRLLPREARGKQHPIDQFFRSLAENQGHMAIGVVLSGTATDGTLGLEEIKAEGGITFAQDDTAQHPGMPHSAVASGCVDFVLPPEGIAGELARIATHPFVAVRPGETGRAAAQRDALRGRQALAPILERLCAASGVDFTQYKVNTLTRRVRRRMVLLKKKELRDYARHLRDDPAEVEALYHDVLINVTSFFRDPELFEALEEKVIPALLADRSRRDPLRVWVLGCSTGDEAYSLAMVLAEAMESVHGHAPPQIFATDVNAAAIEKARAGVYSKERLQNVSRERVGRFFVETNGNFCVAKPIRDMCVFSRHDALSDPPFSRMDLVSCRNLLIYLEPSLQQRVIPVLHYALKPSGFLVLGASETVGPFRDLFAVEDSKHKIYAKKPGPGRLPLLPAPRARPGVPLDPSSRARGSGARTAAARVGSAPGGGDVQEAADRLLLSFAPPAVLVDSNLEILEFRGNTEAYLAPAQGRASHALLKMARQGLRVPLQALLHRAKKEDARVREDGLRIGTGGGEREVNLEAVPIRGTGREGCFLVLFEAEAASAQPRKRTARRRPMPAPRESPEADTVRLEHELAATREYLQALVEQHDSAIEELQAASEEAQSANEELQSINEELETSKEEIESSNEELTTLNEELHNRNLELGQLNNDLTNLITSVHVAVVIVGRDLRVRRFSPMAEKLLNIRSSDAGRAITDIRMNLALPELGKLLAEAIDTVSPREHEVQGRDGHWYSLRVRPYKTLENRIDGAVLMLLDVDALRQAREYAESVIATVRDPLLVLDAELRVRSANVAFYKTFGVRAAETVGRAVHELGNGQWDIPELRRLLEGILPTGSTLEDFVVERDFEHIGRRTMRIHARKLVAPGEERESVLLAIEDVTALLGAQVALRQSEQRYRRLFEAARDGVLVVDPSTRKIIDSNPFMTELLGYPREELVGKELFEIGVLADEQASRAAFRALQEQGVLRYEDLPLEAKTGERREVEMISNLYQENGVQVIQCNIRDISERKRLEAELSKHVEELAAADTEKNNFLAVLSHELRSPLNAIRGWVDILKRPGVSPERVIQGIDVIDRQSRAQADLISDLMDVQRLVSGKVRLEIAEVDLALVIASAVEGVLPSAADKELAIHRRFELDPALIFGDENRLQQVFWNLLSNAIKFTPPGGEISIALRRAGPQAEVSVSDTGEGIAPEALPRLFERFRQADPSTSRGHGGLGLGLSIVKQLVELHGGKIRGESAGKGRGATFTVMLPLRSAEGALRPKALSRRRAGEPMASLAGALVLMVDDEMDAREALCRALEGAGAEVLAVGSTDEAMAAMQQRRPDVLVSDIGMPDRDGYELVRGMRALPRDRDGRVPAIALTAYASSEDRDRALRAGFDLHLAKPVESAELIEAVARLVSRNPEHPPPHSTLG